MVHIINDVTPDVLSRVRKRLWVRTRNYPRANKELRDDAMAFALCQAVCLKPDVPHFENWIVFVAARWLHKQINRRTGMGSPKHRSVDTLVKELPTFDAPVLDALCEGEDALALRAVVATLPSTDREVLFRRYWQQESFETIATEMGMSSGALRTRMGRIKQNLKERLTNEQLL